MVNGISVMQDCMTIVFTLRFQVLSDLVRKSGGNKVTS